MWKLDEHRRYCLDRVRVMAQQQQRPTPLTLPPPTITPNSIPAPPAQSAPLQQQQPPPRPAQSVPNQVVWRNCLDNIADKAWSICIGLAGLAIAVYYGWQALKYARWEYEHDYRDGCESDQVCAPPRY